MRRDSLFYRLFQTSPDLIFQLVANPPENIHNYRFDSVEIKETSFRIDGVFLPTDNTVVYFCEVQFQKDQRLYERLFSELFLYLYRQRDRCTDWRAVIIYPSRSIEQSEITPYTTLLADPKVTRVYLDQLGEIEQLSPGLGLMVLTTLSEEIAPAKARWMLDRASNEPNSRAIIEMTIEIMVYKFTNLSRTEVDKMLGVKLSETRVYREAKSEGREEGREAGREEEARSLVSLLITEKLGSISSDIESEVAALSLTQLQELAKAVLRFDSVTNLQNWLSAH